MPAKVVDANVLAAFIFQEPRAEEAETLIREAELHAPTLLLYELTQIAQKKILQHPDQGEALERALEIALSMNLRLLEIDHLLVLRTALEHGLSAYDASYFYLAQTLGLPLVTFDQRLGSVT